MKRPLFGLAAIAATVVLLDQWTKWLATRHLSLHQPVELLGEFVRLTYTRNPGVAFGLGAGFPFPYYLFSIAAIAVILWLFVRHRVAGRARQIALSLILGGAAGNLIDRLRTGEVVDFIEIGYGRWHWPVFNVADSAVSIGVVLFAFTWSHRTETTEDSSTPQAAPLDPPGGPPAEPPAGILPEPDRHATHSPSSHDPNPPVSSGRAESGPAPGPLPGSGSSGPLA